MAVDKVAKPYAKTLVESAAEQGRLDEIAGDIEVLKSALGNRDLEMLFKSPIVNTGKKKKIINEIFSDKLSDLSMKFLDVILRKKREPLILDIIEASESYIMERKGITKVIVTTAGEVSEDTIKEIKEKVKATGETRAQLEVEHRIDSSLLGGFTVEFDSKIINASVAHKLQELRRTFN